MYEEILIHVVVPLIVALMASSGFWAFFSKKSERKTLQTELLIGLAHDRITWLCMFYINRGFITQDEYENLVSYLFKPYEAIGGNGSARRFMQEVDKLPIRSMSKNTQKGEIQNHDN